MTTPAAGQAAIDEALRRRFEAAWIAGEPLAIDECLPTRDSPAYLPTLEELVQIDLEFAWKAWSARGQGETWIQDRTPAATPPRIEQYVERFAELNQPEIVARLIEQEFLVRERFGDRPTRDEYRRRFGVQSPLGCDETAAAALAEQVTRVPRPSAAYGTTPPATVLRRLGNYELLDEIGRGGMGVVYRARQLSADRIVALKVVRADSLTGLSPAQRASAVERFHHEALATARLDHEHIVAIYEVGEVEGEPFFSMRYVAGASLAELLRSGPLEERRAAAYLEKVARGLAAAHDAGILHRDLKPQNILVEERTDRPLVADFGLAKLLEQPSELTRAGDVMGTPSYMSPEQASDSSRVTAQSDVYSLGATLYHMLAGRPPFQAATAVETLRQVQDAEPVPPSQLNRAVGRDLETICLTCLHKEPARRYRSAAALADDLQRFREGLPILARPTGWPERLVRWCRRNPLLSGALGLAAAFLIAALVATGVGYTTTASALAGKTRALNDSELSYRQSRNVVNQFFTLVSEDVLLDQPGAQPLRNELLKLALGHYQQFLAKRKADTSLLEEIARTHYRVALIQQALEPEASAGRKSLEEALQIQQELFSRARTNEPLQEALGDTLNALGQVHERCGESERAATRFDESRRLRQQLVDAHPGGIALRRKLANTIMNAGLIHKQQGRTAEFQRSLDEAQAIRRMALEGQEIAAADAPTRLLWRDLAIGHYNVANLAVTMKRPDVADQELKPALDILEKLKGLSPNDLRLRERLAASYHLAARRRFEHRDYAGAAQRYEKAIAELTELHRGSPQVVEFQERLALVQLDFGTFHMRRRNSPAAQTAFQAACDLLQPIVPAPDSAVHADRRRNYAVALRELARVQLELKQPADVAAQHLALSQQYLVRLIEQTTPAALRKQLEDDLDQTRQVLQDLEKRQARGGC